MVNDTYVGAGVGLLAGSVLGAAAGYAMGRHRKTTSRKKSKKSRSKYKTKKSHIHSRRRYTPHTAGKHKDTSHRRIRYTSKGQPYVIMGNGRAKFIKKKSAKSSHKRRGGRY